MKFVEENEKVPQDFIGALLNNIFIYGDIGVKVAQLTVAQLAKGQYLHIAPDAGVV